jgi:plasmid stability protein
MAKKQTRRTVSLPRHVHQALTIEAAAHGVSVSQFVIDRLRAAGVQLPETEHLAIERIEHARRRLHEERARRANGFATKRAA